MRMKKPQLIRKRINVKSFKKGKASRNDIIFELLGYSSKYCLKSMATPKNTALVQVSDSVNTYICSADYICNLSVFEKSPLVNGLFPAQAEPANQPPEQAIHNEHNTPGPPKKLPAIQHGNNTEEISAVGMMTELFRQSNQTINQTHRETSCCHTMDSFRSWRSARQRRDRVLQKFFIT